MILKKQQEQKLAMQLIEMYCITYKQKIFLKKYSFLYFSIFMHKKLTYFRYYLKQKYFVLSLGQIIKKKTNKVKFFKKSSKSVGLSINILSKKFKKKLSSIFMFYCKNYNLKNYNWIKKFFKLITPEIEYLVITNSWNYIVKKKNE